MQNCMLINIHWKKGQSETTLNVMLSLKYYTAKFMEGLLRSDFNEIAMTSSIRLPRILQEKGVNKTMKVCVVFFFK